MTETPSPAIASVSELDRAHCQDCPAIFPADMPVSYDAAGSIVSCFGDEFWDLSSMSADGMTPLKLYFFEGGLCSAPDLDLIIRQQHKALLWHYMDSGKMRAGNTLRLANLTLAHWCDKASSQGVQLFSFLTNPESVAEVAQGMNLTYLHLTSSVLRTLWCHRKQLGTPVDFGLQALLKILNQEARSRPETQQTPLIPSRVYCGILAALDERMSVIEREIGVLLDACARSRTSSRNARENGTSDQLIAVRDMFGSFGAGLKGAGGASIKQFVKGRLREHQLALMLVVVAFTGMRKSEVSILPLEGVLVEFEHMGSVHYQLNGATHKLDKGVKRSTTWITSHQGARAVRLAQRIAKSLHECHTEPPRAGQAELLFPSMESPYKRMGISSADTRLNALRASVCPKIEQADIDELDCLELARGWARDGIVVGMNWPLAFHQLRRSLAVYGHRSGMVSLPALKGQLQHITQEMASYYADGFSRAVNLVFDKTHFSHEWQASKAESSYFAYAMGVLFSGEDLLGRGVERMDKAVERRSRQATLRLFEEKKLAYRETALGGCVATEECNVDPLEPVPYHCLETNCVNQVVFGKRLDHVIRFQEMTVKSLESDEMGSVEHRLEARHLEILLKARERLQKGV